MQYTANTLILSLPATDFTDVKRNRPSRWQTHQQQLQQLRQHRSSDHLQSPQQRQRWQRTPPNPQPGDLVPLREDNTAPLHRPTAAITDTHPGKDGIVRVVTIRTPKGAFKRPITKIRPSPRVNSEPQCYCFWGVAARHAKGNFLHFNFPILVSTQLVTAVHDAIITSCVMQASLF
jgi:hypothetical protein